MNFVYSPFSSCLGRCFATEVPCYAACDGACDAADRGARSRSHTRSSCTATHSTELRTNKGAPPSTSHAGGR